MDLLLDKDTHDVVFNNGVVGSLKNSPYGELTQSIAESTAQRLKVRLLTFLGEWFLNIQAGVPYFERVLTKVKHKQVVDMIFQQQILADVDVTDILYFQSTLFSRRYSLIFKVKCRDGSITPAITISQGVS